MGLLDSIKSALGIGRDQEPDPSNERAVKEPAATGTEAGGSTESVTRAHSGDTDDGAAEPAEAAGEVTDHAGTERAAAEPAEAAGPTDDEPDAAAASVEVLSGVGPAYAGRLADADVESVADLAAADTATLAEETGISAKRIGRWQEAAEEHRE